jgi:hypothetical protein
MPDRGRFRLDRPVEEAGLFSRYDLRSVTSRVLVGEAEIGGEFALKDLSDRLVNEKELSLRLCLGISTVGEATAGGPSTPVLTMLVVLGVGSVLSGRS